MSRYVKIDGFTQAQVLGFIRVKLITDKEWQLRAIKNLYACQTNREKSTYRSIMLNDEGFGKVDAPILTLIAKRVEAKQELSNYHWQMLRALLPNYSEQVEATCDPYKLKQALNLFYFGSRDYIDSDKFRAYAAKYFKPEKFVYSSKVSEYQIIFRNKQHYEYVVGFDRVENKVGIHTRKSLKKYSCSPEVWKKFRDYVVKSFKEDNDSQQGNLPGVRENS